MTKQFARWLIVVIVVAIIGVLFYAVIQRLDARAKILEAEYKTLQKAYEASKEAWAEEKNALNESFDKALDKVEKDADLLVAKAEKEKSTIKEEYEDFKDLIATATNDEITTKLNTEIGEEFVLTNSGYFRMTRPGAELVLSFVYDSKKFERLYSVEVETSTGLRDQIKTIREGFGVLWDKNEKAWAGRLTSAEEVQDKCNKALKACKVSKNFSLVKGVVIGAVITSFVWTVLTLAR